MKDMRDPNVYWSIWTQKVPKEDMIEGRNRIEKVIRKRLEAMSILRFIAFLQIVKKLS